MIAAQKRQHRLAVRHHDEALHLRSRRKLGEFGDIENRLLSGRVELLRRQISLRIGRRGLRSHRHSLFEIRVIPALAADRDQVLARARRHHELVRLAAAHRSRMRLDRDRLQPAALEDPRVGLIVLLVSGVQPGGVEIERVGVLHDELPHAQQSGFRPRLVAKLGLDLVPDLRQLLVAAQLAPRDRRHHLFVRHAEAQVAVEAVLEPEHVLAHDVPAAGFLPDLGRMQRRQQHLLPADRVHLLAHDRRNLVERTLGKKQVAVNARRQLTNVPGAKQQLVAHGLGLDRILPQRGDEKFAPEHCVVVENPSLAYRAAVYLDAMKSTRVSISGSVIFFANAGISAPPNLILVTMYKRLGLAPLASFSRLKA